MSYLSELQKSIAVNPDLEIFKVGPEIIEDFIGKLIIVMGGKIPDIQNVNIGQDKKKIRILALIDKNSDIFCKQNERSGGLSLLGNSSTEIELAQESIEILKGIGYYYVESEDDDRDVPMFTVTEYRKYIEIEFNAEVTMALITNSNFGDEYFIVDAIEEVVNKKREQKRYSSHKFKGKKKTVVFARVQRSYFGVRQGYDPKQISDWKLGIADDEDGDDCD